MGAILCLLFGFSCSSGGGATQPTPTPPTGATIWVPAPKTTWQWQLQGTIDRSFDVEMYDIDLVDTPQETIDALHAEGRIVICYFSAGSYENFRSDASKFTPEMLGNEFSDFPDENWLDIRIPAIRPIMEDRMLLARDKNCDGVEPDNVDGYINDTGFPLTFADQLDYNQWLALKAHELGLSIGLKNDLDQIPQLLDHFDWALNEQCFQYNECDKLSPFIDAGKAVFGVEYEGSPSQYCPELNALQFSWLVKDYDLFALPRQDCMDIGTS